MKFIQSDIRDRRVFTGILEACGETWIATRQREGRDNGNDLNPNFNRI